jgi:hypothetical protein
MSTRWIQFDQSMRLACALVDHCPPTYRNAVSACATQLYNPALATVVTADQVAGNTTASDKVKANGVDHYINFDCLQEALRLTIAALLPQKILAKVKRSMHQDMQKPKNMKVRTYY